MAVEPRIGILIVAYNAATTLASVLDRIPTEFRPEITDILVCDDHSQDDTYNVGLEYQRLVPDLPLTVIRHPANLGYGGNQKAGYRLAMDRGLDIVVLLHGDGQYAPECLSDLVDPLRRGECDAVFGSRMLAPGAARQGGMPLYKYVGNRILTTFENRMLGTALSEFHSGYRAYRTDALREIPFEQNSDGFDFDTEIIVQLVDRGKAIVEVPIPTYYGDELCYVNGLRYARDVVADVLRYRLGKMGLGTSPLVRQEPGYDFKDDPDSSHTVLLERLAELPPARVLDLGCSAGLLAERVRKLGHSVVGVDQEELDGVRDRVDAFVPADLDRGIPAEAGEGFDVILAADVLEHLRQPRSLLQQARRLLRPDGFVLASVPNFGHWYPRVRTALGLFDYDRRGILDDGHTRFFTRRSFARLARSAGFTTARTKPVGLPLAHVVGRTGTTTGLAGPLDRAAVRLRPTLFAYQFVFELDPAPFAAPKG